MVSIFFYVLAAVFFLLDAFRVPAAVSWTPLGFCAVTIGFLLAGRF